MIQVIEIHSKAKFELLIRRRGRLILKGAGKEVVVLGFGSSWITAVDDLNNSSVATKQNLFFMEV